jgi:hypothetical protein
MKTILIAVTCLAVGSLSAIAGSCPAGGCGDKGKGKDKGEGAPKESAASYVIES